MTTTTATEAHVVAERVTEEVRQEVLYRDQFQCLSCGTGGENRLNLHHVKYRSQGGTHGKENLITLCFICHKMHHDGWLPFVVIEVDGILAVFFNRKYFYRRKK